MNTLRFNFTGYNAIITGAGAGVGRAIAFALSAAGASVLINDLNPDRIDDLADQITAQGGQALPWQGDIANRFQAAGMIEHARERFGRIHLLINAAGVFKSESLLKLDEWDWRRMIDVNLTGAFFCCQLLGRVMKDEGGGVMINLAPAFDYPESAGYSASNAGVIALTRQAAREYAAYGIRVNAVCIGAIDEEDMPPIDLAHIPQGRVGSPESVAQAVMFLCSDAAASITGQTLTVDGGASLLIP
ncbi:MAG: SDR family oxidoreductase [Anaerolineae bacterium]|nr:SDR family oxidoreductase [Anaerolineae bacterium]